MGYTITFYQSTTEDIEIRSLLTSVFVGEGYTDESIANAMFTLPELRKRGEIILARDISKIVGIVIFVPPTSQSRQVAKSDESEIHLLAVYPKARGQGIASSLISACEQRAMSSGCSKMVLSTQQSMKDAHRVYEKHGYVRNFACDWSRDGKIYHVYEKPLGKI